MTDLPYAVRKTKDNLEKVVKMSEEGKELERKIISTVTKMFDISDELRDAKIQLKQLIKQYDTSKDKEIAEAIANLEISIERYKRELQVVRKELRQFKKDYFSLRG